MTDNVTQFPPGGHKSKRPSGRTPAGRGNGSKGPGMGDGYGGAAKGVGAGPEALIPGQGGEKQIRSLARKDREAKTAQAMRAIIEHLAHNASREETQLMAANAMLDRIEGKPIQRNLNATMDDVAAMGDDELRNELEALAKDRA